VRVIGQRPEPSAEPLGRLSPRRTICLGRSGLTRWVAALGTRVFPRPAARR
jgi:hypothetical protein